MWRAVCTVTTAPIRIPADRHIIQKALIGKPLVLASDPSPIVRRNSVKLGRLVYLRLSRSLALSCLSEGKLICSAGGVNVGGGGGGEGLPMES